MTQAAFDRWFLLGFAAIALVVAPVLLRISAPYGRHARAGWGPRVPATLAWVAMEAPSPILMAWMYLRYLDRQSLASTLLLGLWQLHYLNRTFIFPLRRRGGVSDMPLLVALWAALFNLGNGYLNGRWVFGIHSYPIDWLASPRFVIGAALFLFGWYVNVQSDAILRALRRPGETGYKIPHGGLYRWVSSPNYLGEMLEWIGWSIATWSPAGVVFAVWTIANLGPRALTNHRWYRERFPDYPSERRALVPYLF